MEAMSEMMKEFAMGLTMKEKVEEELTGRMASRDFRSSDGEGMCQ